MNTRVLAENGSERLGQRSPLYFITFAIDLAAPLKDNYIPKGEAYILINSDCKVRLWDKYKIFNSALHFFGFLINSTPKNILNYYE